MCIFDFVQLKSSFAITPCRLFRTLTTNKFENPEPVLPAISLL